MPPVRLSKSKQEILKALADFDDEHFKSRTRKQGDKDDIIIFRTEKIMRMRRK
jgi:hypothetical protein